MKVINIGENNSVLNSFIAQLRDRSIQKDRMRFRQNLERVGEIFAYEVSRTLNYSTKDVRTPLGIASVNTFDDKLVIATILRAGLPLHSGLLNFFDGAESAFVAAYRKYDKSDDYHISIEYATAPDVTGKVLILCDTLLATGASIEIAWDRIREDGEPAYTHFVCPVASAYAIEHMQKHLPTDNATLWVAAVDEELTSQSYIVPGLGDAGDLAFGQKV